MALSLVVKVQQTHLTWGEHGGGFPDFFTVACWNCTADLYISQFLLFTEPWHWTEGCGPLIEPGPSGRHSQSCLQGVWMRSSRPVFFYRGAHGVGKSNQCDGSLQFQPLSPIYILLRPHDPNFSLPFRVCRLLISFGGGVLDMNLISHSALGVSTDFSFST